MTTVTFARRLGIGIVMICLALISLVALDYGPYSTYPIHILIVAFLAYPVAWQLAALLVPVLFLGWSFFLARGKSEIPRRSAWLLVILVAGSVLNFASAWHDGLRFSSRNHFVSLILLNLVLVIPIAIFGFLGRKRPSEFLNWAFHVLLFCWLAFAAFPYFGELP